MPFINVKNNNLLYSSIMASFCIKYVLVNSIKEDLIIRCENNNIYLSQRLSMSLNEHLSKILY